MRDMTVRREGVWYAKKKHILPAYVESKVRSRAREGEEMLTMRWLDFVIMPSDALVFVRDRVGANGELSGHDVVLCHMGKLIPAWIPRMNNPHWNKIFER